MAADGVVAPDERLSWPRTVAVLGVVVALTAPAMGRRADGTGRRRLWLGLTTAVVIAATFRGQPGEPAAIQAEMDRIAAAREASQPLRSRTGGSTFKNPPGHKAWQLVDRAGCRGLRRGGAQGGVGRVGLRERQAEFGQADHGRRGLWRSSRSRRW